MTEPTYIQKCIAGEALPDEIDDHVDRWHAGEGQGISLAEYLGLTDAEYKAWVEDPEALTGILASKEKGSP